MAKIPARGPLLLVTNHVNFLEAPVIITRIQPRPLTGFVKVETWANPFIGALFSIWGGIPVHRGAADRQALRSGLQALEKGFILGVTPEGTRSGDGVLSKGHPGIVMLALKSGAPILPLAFHGGELFWDNLRRLRRTDFKIVVGEPFELIPNVSNASREVRNEILDEIMYQLAALLPAQYRGAYANLDSATSRYLVFSDPVRNNLALPADGR
ncbi:MAG: lysophospholipid acyltransferase family protein [Anaerolineales bacterium]|nr:lysophospholipid acyltransferase family protein [Anaerolineales bacterium]